MNEIDNREYIFYQLIDMLKIDPDSFPHYWSTILKIFSFIDDNKKHKICEKCNSSELIVDFKNKLYCLDDNNIIVDETNKGNIKNIRKKNNKLKHHKIIDETGLDTANRMINDILNMIKEPSGYVMSLYELESYMQMNASQQSFFETETGETTKFQINSELNKIAEFIIERLREIQKDIRFSTVLQRQVL